MQYSTSCSSVLLMSRRKYFFPKTLCSVSHPKTPREAYSPLSKIFYYFLVGWCTQHLWRVEYILVDFSFNKFYWYLQINVEVKVICFIHYLWVRCHGKHLSLCYTHMYIAKMCFLLIPIGVSDLNIFKQKNTKDSTNPDFSMDCHKNLRTKSSFNRHIEDQNYSIFFLVHDCFFRLFFTLT